MFISKDQRLLTHALHKYPAKFFPELPRWLIEKYSNEGDLILDPFMGSGTTNLECMLLGRDSIGIDVDPFSRMLASVKTTPLPERALQSAWRELSGRVASYVEPSHLKNVPDFPYKDNWFQPFIQKELAFIKRTISEIDMREKVRRFFLINFSSIIRAVSQADNNCTRTVIRKKDNKNIYRGMAIQLFLSKTEKQVQNMCDFSALKLSSKIKIPTKDDARNMQSLRDNSIDCAITSPPYANAVDYPRTHQLELYWLGLASGSLRDLKVGHVGTEVVKSDEYKNLSLVAVSEADKVLKKIYESDPRRSYIASKYLRDMFQNLAEVYKKLKKGGVYVIVVGNNTIRGMNFETWKYLGQKAPDIGFSVDCCFSSEIINHFIKIARKEQIARDHILILRK